MVYARRGMESGIEKRESEMRKLNPNNCKAVVYDGSVGRRQCRRRISADGFCSVHHPDRVKARTEESYRRADDKAFHSAASRLERALARITDLELLVKSQEEMLDWYRVRYNGSED